MWLSSGDLSDGLSLLGATAAVRPRRRRRTRRAVHGAIASGAGRNVYYVTSRQLGRRLSCGLVRLDLVLLGNGPRRPPPAPAAAALLLIHRSDRVGRHSRRTHGMARNALREVSSLQSIRAARRHPTHADSWDLSAPEWKQFSGGQRNFHCPGREPGTGVKHGLALQYGRSLAERLPRSAPAFPRKERALEPSASLWHRRRLARHNPPTGSL